MSHTVRIWVRDTDTSGNPMMVRFLDYDEAQKLFDTLRQGMDSPEGSIVSVDGSVGSFCVRMEWVVCCGVEQD